MRFFHKFCTINYRFFGLVNNIMISVKRKTGNTKSIEYASKHAYILDDIKKIETSDKYPNKIWQLWFQGKDSVPPIIKKCTETVEKFHGDRVIFLDNKNLFDYVELPDYIIDKHKKGIITYANLSDMIRMYLLAKYGGTWVDSTIYLTDKIPDTILNSEFFSFKTFQTNLLEGMNGIEDYKMYCNFFNYPFSLESSFFIHSKSGNELINGMLNLFFEYWKHENSLCDYLLIDRFFALAVLYNENFKEQFLNMPYYSVENVHLMQEALLEKFDQKLFDQISAITPIHKLTHKNLHRNAFKDSFLNKILEG